MNTRRTVGLVAGVLVLGLLVCCGAVVVGWGLSRLESFADGDAAPRTGPGQPTTWETGDRYDCQSSGVT